MPSDYQVPKPVVLVVIDGWGYAPPWGGNAVTLAETTYFDQVIRTYPRAILQAAGQAVGLPQGERGNSEVGHLNIGAGQIVHQALPSISSAIQDGSFYTNQILLGAFNYVKQSGGAIHLLGLTSNGGIHSHEDHLYGLLEMARQQQVTNVCIHAITDGRDTPPFVAEEHLSRLNARLRELGFGRICTVSGRYYSMDRDHRWERIEKSYRAMTEGVGPVAKSAEGAVAAAYREGYSDEFIPPTVVQGQNNSFQPIQDNDAIIFFNFRADRAREISQAFMKPNFDGFKRRKTFTNLHFVGFTYYQEGLETEVAFRPKDVNYPLARVLAEAKIRQLHVAESEKYAHVTYFFNGGREEAYLGEDRIVVPSPHVPSFDQTPEMSVPQVTDSVVHNIGRYDFIICNFACPDMVGHTGNLRATIQACEAVDEGLKKIAHAVEKKNGLLIITADHGNAEQMVNPKTGEPDTEHTASPVPYVMVGASSKGWQIRPTGMLSDIAPTVLQVFGLSKPQEMTGRSLFELQVSVSQIDPVATVMADIQTAPATTAVTQN